jgi:hypothetical protein
MFGLLAPQCLLLVWSTVTGRSVSSSDLLGVPLVTLAALVIVAPVWFLLLVPLYCLVPRGSVLWHWPICTACGVVAGAAIATYLSGEPRSSFTALAAVTGGATCLFGSLSRHYFHAGRSHEQSEKTSLSSATSA